MTRRVAARGLFLVLGLLLVVALFGHRRLADLFSWEQFMPHGHCYMWKRGVVWLHVVSDGLIFLAYVAISSILVFFVMKRKDLPFDWMFMMFGAFVLACGVGHLIDVVTLWKPMYWLSGIERALTAGVSVATAIVLVPLVPKALALPSPAELREANFKLHAEVAERQQAERELEAAMALLRQQHEALLRSEKLAAVGQLAASVGHELRNPLAVIRNAVYYLSNRVTPTTLPELDARVPQLIAVMEREVAVAAKIISGLLDFARERPPQREPCVLGLLVDEAIQLAPGTVRVENRVPADLALCDVDRDQFRQVLINLIQNAMDATAPDSTQPVVVKAEGGGQVPWLISVIDAGSGISSEAMPRIFEPLYTSKIKGTGLGLAIVKSIISAHGGQISVTSTLGVGTTFTVLLPAASA